MTRTAQKWTVGVKTEGGQIVRTTSREFETQRAAFLYAANRQFSKRFLHFVAFRLDEPKPEWLARV